MKVGKRTVVHHSPAGTIIYATNMVPRIIRPGEPEYLEVEVERYELERQAQAKKHGELE